MLLSVTLDSEFPLVYDRVAMDSLTFISLKVANVLWTALLDYLTVILEYIDHIILVIGLSRLPNI